MDARAAVALALLLPPVAGCLGAPAPFDGGLPSGSAEVPPLPDLGMDDATVLEHTATSVTFLWEATLARGSTEVRAAFDVPQGPPFRVRALVSSEPADATPFVFVLDAEENRRCMSWFQTRAPLLRCSVPWAGPAEGRWSVLVGHLDPDLGPGSPAPQDVGLRVELRVESQPPRPLASVRSLEPFEAQVDADTVLRGALALPEGDGPFATVLVMSPYWAEGGDTFDLYDVTLDGRRTLFWYLQPLADAGFAVALVNLRGTGVSDGCYSPMNHPQNGPDAAAVVEALAAQPWSNGAVGTYGMSYEAGVQDALLAADPPPALKAAIPMSGEIDEWNLLGRYGAVSVNNVAHPLVRATFQGGGLQSPLASGAPRPEAVHWCPGTLDALAKYSQLGWNGDKDAWLQARDLREGLRGITVPVLRSNGLGLREGHLLQFEGWWDLPAGPKRLVLGQQDHRMPEAERDDWWEEVQAWFDHHLRGGPSLLPSQVEYQDDTYAWHTAPSWPPPGARRALSLGDGVLTEAPAGASLHPYVASDAGAATLDGACDGAKGVWASEPLREEVLLAGNFAANLTLTSAGPNANIVAALFWTRDGAACPSSGHLVSRALSDLRHRGHLPVGQDVPVGVPFEVALRSYPFASVVPEGARLVLVVAGGDVRASPRGSPVVAVHGGASTLDLPLVEGALRFQEGTRGGGSGVARGLDARDA